MASAKKTIEDVKGRHEMTLMQVPGVEGVGIGEDASGQKVIKVYVSDASKAVRDRVPKELEGHPVHVEISGEFHAQ